jgi:hypothetical protein
MLQVAPQSNVVLQSPLFEGKEIFHQETPRRRMTARRCVGQKDLDLLNPIKTYSKNQFNNDVRQ